LLGKKIKFSSAVLIFGSRSMVALLIVTSLLTTGGLRKKHFHFHCGSLIVTLKIKRSLL